MLLQDIRRTLKKQITHYPQHHIERNQLMKQVEGACKSHEVPLDHNQQLEHHPCRLDYGFAHYLFLQGTNRMVKSPIQTKSQNHDQYRLGII